MSKSDVSRVCQNPACQKLFVMQKPRGKGKFCSILCWYAAKKTAKAALFFTLVKKRKDGHWEFLGPKTKWGHGRFCIRTPDGHFQLAHRYSWYLHKGPIPSGKQVNHKRECSRPWCVNPKCLYPGTQKENVDDLIAVKGKHPRAGLAPANKGVRSVLRGERHPSATLTSVEALAIKRDAHTIHKGRRGKASNGALAQFVLKWSTTLNRPLNRNTIKKIISGRSTYLQPII